jgi:hypothetical protein
VTVSATDWTPAETRAAQTIPHRPNCPAHRVRPTTHGDGTVAMKCRGCGAWRPVETIALPPVAEPSRASRFVCPEHGTPVAWHGRDCPECAQDAQNRAQERAARRRRLHAARLARGAVE